MSLKTMYHKTVLCKTQLNTDLDCMKNTLYHTIAAGKHTPDGDSYMHAQVETQGSGCLMAASLAA